MNYPLISEYIEAIKAAKDNFDQLKHLRPVLDDDGLPVMTSGNFAVVFKMKDEQTGKFYAVKCFTKEQEGRAEAYKLITEELATVDSPYILSIKYLEKELFVDTEQTDETEFPVLLMDWVEGKTLDKYLRENLDDKYALEMLAYRFSQLAQWLIPQPFAHGDLKPDNILVKEDGTLVLVDYDGMYVPAMKGQKARELGSPDFRHPSRTEGDFDEHIDDFALLILTFSILIACESPSSFSFPVLTNDDFHSLNTSQSLKHIFPSSNAAINKTVSAIVNCIIDNEMMLSLTIYDTIAKQIRWNYYIYAQNYDDLLKGQCIDGYTYYKKFHRESGFDENSKHYPVSLATAVDKVDVEYEYPYAYNYNHSFYKGILLNASDIYEDSYLGEPYAEFWVEMSLPSDTIVIGKEALSNCAIVELIVVPNSVKYVGDKAFYNCENLRYIVFPESIEGFGTDIFSLKDSYVNSITGNTDTQHYGKGAHSLVNIIVPDGTKEYYANLLPDYRHLIVDFSEIANSKDPAIKSLFDNTEKKKVAENRKLSTEVTDEDIANAWTDEYGVRYSHDKKRLLKGPEIDFIKDDYFINPNTKVICEDAFRECFFYKAIIPNGVEIVGNYAFYKCFYLNYINLPNSITDIGYSAFESCGLMALDIPDSIRFIGIGAFSCCEHLSFIKIGCGLSKLENSVFSNCYDLEEIIIPNNITSIEKYAFSYCDSLKSISLPSSIKSIYEESFIGCDALQSIVVPKGKKQLFETFLPKFKGIIVEDTNLDPRITDKDLGNAWIDEFGVKYSEDKKRLLKADRQIKKYSILKGTMVICDNAFEFCDIMTSVSIPDSVVTIGRFAFSCCESLKHITFPKSITNIGYGAFDGCKDLTSITIPSSVTFVGSFAFLNCAKLTSVAIPNSVTYIGKEPFKRCSNLETIYISNGLFAKFEKLLPNYKDKIVEE